MLDIDRSSEPPVSFFCCKTILNIYAIHLNINMAPNAFRLALYKRYAFFLLVSIILNYEFGLGTCKPNKENNYQLLVSSVINANTPKNWKQKIF